MSHTVPPSPTLARAVQSAQALGLSRLEAQLLLLHALGRDGQQRAWLLAHDQDALAPLAAAQFAALCQRFANDEPLAYLLGWQEFFGLNLQVDARVLVPRPDTEVLVEWALELLAPQAAARVLDLGTGSGAIALALKHSLPTLQVQALDYSADALAVAQANAQRLGLEVAFSQGAWLQGLPVPSGGFAAIVSNPPYIVDTDRHLPALRHEPLSALASGADGLDDLRQIVAQAPAYLAAGGCLLLEHGYDQAPAVRALLQAAGFAQVQSRRDLAGIERCSGGQWLV